MTFSEIFKRLFSYECLRMRPKKEIRCTKFYLVVYLLFFKSVNLLLCFEKFIICWNICSIITKMAIHNKSTKALSLNSQPWLITFKYLFIAFTKHIFTKKLHRDNDTRHRIFEPYLVETPAKKAKERMDNSTKTGSLKANSHNANNRYCMCNKVNRETMTSSFKIFPYIGVTMENIIVV